MGLKGRGAFKRKAGGFGLQKNCNPWNKGLTFEETNDTAETAKFTPKPLKRLTCQDFDRTFTLNNDGAYVPFAERVVSSPVEHSPGAVLRPKFSETSEVERKLKEKKDHEEVSGYIEVHLQTTVDLVQDCTTEHSGKSPGCSGRLVTSTDLVTKWGLSAIIQLKCNTCAFVSAKHKLFREVPRDGRGRRCAEPNRALAAGLISTSIGAAGSRRLFSAIGKTLPAPSSMQKQLNKAGDIIGELNETDMALQRTKLKDILEHGGYDRETPIPAEGDRQYNNGLRSGRRHTPFAPATQTRDVLAENLTPEKKIICYNQENKLCKVGEMSRVKGANVKCPGHEGCTATISASDNAGDEKRGGRKLASKLKNGREKINIGMLTTDADGRMFDGFSDEIKGDGNVSPEHLLDTIHLNRSLSRAITNSKLEVTLATSKPCNYTQRKQAKKNLADSIAWRAEREVRAAIDQFKDESSMVEAAGRAISAIILCYQGEHSLCKKHSSVCDGVHLVYEYLPEYARGTFRFSQDDAKLLTTILLKRMGREALHKTRFGLTTQKAESMNHAFATTNPKHTMTCYRNGANRDHSAIHMVNNLVGDSILIKAKACGVPISPNALCLGALHQMNRRQAYFRHRSRSKSYKFRRACLRRRRYTIYDMTRNESYYSKGQLNPK